MNRPSSEAPAASTPTAIEEAATAVASRRRPDIVSWPPARRNQWLLAGVAVCFLLFQLLAIGLRYQYTTDEAVYLSQVNPLVPDYRWVAWRAWGMPALSAPVALINAPLPVVRLYFVLVSSAGLFLAFRPWLALSSRPLAPVAAALMGGSAVAVYNGPLALPNYYSALAAVAATGFFVACRRGTDNHRRSAVGLAVAVAFAALVRPSDSVWLVFPLLLAWLGLRAWRRPAIGGAIAVGQVVGWAPWVIESFFRFDGPLARLHLSSEVLGGTHLYPDLAMVWLYLRLWSSGNVGAVSLDVPRELRGGAATLETVHLAPISFVDMVWWIGVAGAILAGVLAVVRARATAEGLSSFVIPLVVGLSVTFPYLFMMRYGQLRFLLPAVGLLALPIAYGVLQIGTLRKAPVRALGPGLAVTLLLGLIGVQVATARQYHSGASRTDVLYSSLVERLRELGVSRPCAIAGRGVFTVAYQIGCDTLGSLNPTREEPEPVASARSRGESVAIVLRAQPPAGTFVDRWRMIRVDVRGQARTWFVYLPPS